MVIASQTEARRLELGDGRVLEIFARNGRIVSAYVTVTGWTLEDAVRVIREARVSGESRRILARAFADHLKKLNPAMDRERFVRHVLGARETPRRGDAGPPAARGFVADRGWGDDL